MKNSTLYSVVILTLALVAAPSTQAATVNWIPTTGTNNWYDTANWSGGVLPAAGDTADITSAADTNVVVTLDSSAVTGILNIGSGSAFDDIHLGGGTLRMDNNGSEAAINLKQNGNNTGPISSVILEMTAGGLAINKTTNDGTSTISGMITNTLGTTNTLTLTSTTSSILRINNDIREGSGPLKVVVQNNSAAINKIELRGINNNFSGGILVKNGSLGGYNGNSTVYGTGTITLGDAATVNGAGLNAEGGIITNNIIVSSASTKSTYLLYRNGVGSTTELSGAIDLQKRADLVVASGANVSMVVSGNISGSGDLMINNQGTGTNAVFTLSGSNSHTGRTTLYAQNGNGTSKLILGNTHALGTGAFRVVGNQTNRAYLDTSIANFTNANNNAMMLDNDLTYIGTNGNSLNWGTGAVTVTNNVTRKIYVQNGVLTFGGAISGTGAGTNFSLVKDGTGTLALNGISTFTNTTTVSAGILRGTGTVAGDLTIGNGAFLQAGDGGIGTFTAGGVANFQNGSTFTFELNTTAATYDQLIANGLTIGSTASITFSDLGGSAWGIGTKITIIDNTSGSAISGIFAGYAEGYEFTLGANLFKTTYLGGNGNDFALEVVPEPSTIALLVAGLGAVALLRRRRQS